MYSFLWFNQSLDLHFSFGCFHGLLLYLLKDILDPYSFLKDRNWVLGLFCNYLHLCNTVSVFNETFENVPYFFSFLLYDPLLYTSYEVSISRLLWLCTPWEFLRSLFSYLWNGLKSVLYYYKDWSHQWCLYHPLTN